MKNGSLSTIMLYNIEFISNDEFNALLNDANSLSKLDQDTF